MLSTCMYIWEWIKLHKIVSAAQIIKKNVTCLDSKIVIGTRDLEFNTSSVKSLPAKFHHSTPTCRYHVPVRILTRPRLHGRETCDRLEIFPNYWSCSRLQQQQRFLSPLVCMDRHKRHISRQIEQQDQRAPISEAWSRKGKIQFLLACSCCL